MEMQIKFTIALEIVKIFMTVVFTHSYLLNKHPHFSELFSPLKMAKCCCLTSLASLSSNMETSFLSKAIKCLATVVQVNEARSMTALLKQCFV